MFKIRAKTLLILLFSYVILQFAWWAFLLNKSLNSPGMILGEGLVFVALLSIGAYKLFSSYEKEKQVFLNQKNFLLSVTHELKTPLASIQLNLQTLSKHKLDAELEHTLFKNSLSDVKRLDKMVENMLLATQMDTDTFKLYQEKVDVKQFLNDLVDCYRKTIQHAHHIELVLDCDASQIEIDTFSMQIAIHNLLDNALKYGLNKPIVLSAQCSAQTLEIQVKDQGIGIDKKEQQQIFKKFYRVGNEDVRKHKGTGLGLFIVQQIIEKHKGKIELHSVLGEGSAFNIKLPLV